MIETIIVEFGQANAKGLSLNSRKFLLTHLKSNNLQYNTLGPWVDGPNDSSTKRLMFQVLVFFIISYRLRALKTLYFYFCKVIKKWEIKLKGFFAKNFENNYEKNNTWNIRRLVNETIIPSSQRPSVLYWRLSDLWKEQSNK